MKLKLQHKSSKWLVAAGAAGLLAAPAAPALAASAQASFADFTILLLDTNWADGVSPSLTWDSGNVYTNASLELTGSSPFVGGMSDGSLFSAWNVQQGGPSTDGRVTITGAASPLFAGGGMLASGNANAPGTSFTSNAYTGGFFTLSPYTIAYFIANGAINTATNGAGESAQARVEMSVSTGGDGVAVNQSSASSIVSPSSNSTESSPLFVSFANLTNGLLWGNFQASVSASGVAPVPEPEAYAMLLAGLGLVAGMAKRRRKTAA